MKFNISFDISIWTIFFYLSNLYFTGNSEIGLYFGVSFLLVLFLTSLRTLNVKKENKRINKKLLYVWLIFSLTILITNLINKNNILYGLILNTIIPYFFIYRVQYYKSIKTIILKSIVISTIILIFNTFGFIKILIVNVNMQSNSMGLFMMIFSIYSLYKFYYSDKCFFIVIINFIFVFLSSSRTSLISFILVFLVVIIFKITKTNLTKAILRLYFILSTAIVIILVIFLFEDRILRLQVIEKIIFYSSEGNNLNGRDLIWSYIIKNSNFTGHNLNILFNLFNLSPHNNFLGILFTNGFIAFIAFILINSIMLFKSIKNFIKNDNDILNFLTMVIFILTSMTEYYFNILGIGLVYLWYICLGDIMFNKTEIQNFGSLER